MEKMVITVDGTEELRSNCRRISGAFYRIGDPKVKDSGQCYKVNGRYCRAETGYIVYDYTTGEYVTNNDSLVEGVIGVEGDKLILGHFTTPKYPVTVENASGNVYTLLNESIIENNRYYRFLMSKDRYVYYSLYPSKEFNKLQRVRPEYKNSLEYDSREVMGNYMAAYNENDLVIGKKVKQVAPYLKGLTFGIEFESVQGVVPERVTKPLGLIPLRDGSVAGLEYATIPYEGEKGLQATVESCKALGKFTRYDENCSLHLHIGNIPRTEEFFLAMFKTLCLVQDEMFEMFPIYKKYNFGVKKKPYTQPFATAKMLSKMDAIITPKNIKENFSVLYEFLSAGQHYGDVGQDLGNVHSHPSDPHGNRKWNIKSRYFWVNLIPLLFGNKKTVEFRIHTPTTDPDKVIYYLFFCTSIVNFVKENTEMILGNRDTSYGDLSTMIISTMRGAPKALIDNLLRYINLRKQYTAMDNHAGNIRGTEDRIKAPKYGFDKEVPEVPVLDGPSQAELDRALEAMRRVGGIEPPRPVRNGNIRW